MAYAITTYMHGYDWLVEVRHRRDPGRLLVGDPGDVAGPVARLLLDEPRRPRAQRSFSRLHPQLPHAVEVEPDLLRVRRRVRGVRPRRHRRRHDQHRDAVRVHPRVRRACGSCACERPEIPRDFKTPLVPLFPILGIVVCAGDDRRARAGRTGCGWRSGWRSAWSIYAFYGRKHSKLRAGITVNVGGGGPVTVGERPPPSQ